MNRVAIAYLTKDRVELTKQTLEPLAWSQHALFWCDGSATDEGKKYFETYRNIASNGSAFADVRGGADAAIVFALTTMLAHEAGYTHVGLCESDVLLSASGGWFEQTMALFEQGHVEGLNVGAVSPRCYEDRILIQRDGYALMHNLGSGIVIFTREAARIILDHYRTAWSTDNRNTFCQLSGIDIGPTWAFKGNQQWLTADWGFDAILARSGLCSLALTPSPVEMVGQSPSLEEQGLTLACAPVERLHNDRAFETFCHRSKQVWEGQVNIMVGSCIHQDPLGNYTIFPHQIHKLGGVGTGDWRLQWSQGFGPFAYRSERYLKRDGEEIEYTAFTIPLSGHCEFLVSGGKSGAQVEVTDLHSGFTCNPVLAPEGPDTQVMSIAVPAGVSYREVRLTALTPGAVFYGIRTREPQMLYHGTRFDHSMLPPV